MALIKVNFTTNDDLKEWYKVEAEKMGISMSALMSFVLSQYKKTEESRMVLAELNQANKNIDMSQMLEMLKLANEIDKTE